MSLKYASLLKISAAGIILLSVGACKPANKGQGALKSEGIAALNLSKSDSSVFSKYFSTQPCEVDELEALGALAGLGLGENGANDLTFASRNFSDGLVTYRDMVVQNEDEVSFTVKTAVFHCPQMGDEAPGFARLDLTDALVRDTEGTTFTLGTLNIASPTPDAAGAIVDGMVNPTARRQGDIGFKAVSVTDAKIQADALNGALKALAWGEMRDETGAGKADLTIENLNLTVPGSTRDQDMTLDFKGMSARNLNIGGGLDAQKAMTPDGAIGGVLGNLNAFQKPYDQLIVDILKIDSDLISVDFGGIEGQTEENGDIITTRQSLKPTVISLKPALSQIQQFERNYGIMKTLGFETMEISGSSVSTLNSAEDSVTVSDGLLVVKDGFSLNFEYSAEGLAEMTQKLGNLAEAGETPDPLAAYDSLKLRDLRLTLEDNSIVERGLKLASIMLDQSEQNIKRSLGLAVFAAALKAENDLQAEVYTETVDAFADFVKKGGSLTIEANPPAPFPLAPLLSNQGEEIDPDELGFSAIQEGGGE